MNLAVRAALVSTGAAVILRKYYLKIAKDPDYRSCDLPVFI